MAENSWGSTLAPTYQPVNWDGLGTVAERLESATFEQLKAWAHGGIGEPNV